MARYQKMLKKVFCTSLVLLLCSCGTTKGVLDGAGSVLEGLASDVRSVGDYLNQLLGQVLKKYLPIHDTPPWKNCEL